MGAVQDRNFRGMGRILFRPPATFRQRVNFGRPTVDTASTDALACRSDKHRVPASLTAVISPRHSKPKVQTDPSASMRTGLVLELHTRMKGSDDWQRFTRRHDTYTVTRKRTATHGSSSIHPEPCILASRLLHRCFYRIHAAGLLHTVSSEWREWRGSCLGGRESTGASTGVPHRSPSCG